jgi:glucosamine--fructose-6-phosphate aminotransferase (isomerizing)
MCGIIGSSGGREALPRLLDGLRRAEDRGYGSAGIALSDEQGLASVRVVARR